MTTILHFVVFTNKFKQIRTLNAAFYTAQISPFASLCKYIVSTHFLFFPLAHFNAVFLPNPLKVCKTHQHFSKGQDGHLSAITSNTFPPSISIALCIPHYWLANHYSKSYFQNKWLAFLPHGPTPSILQSRFIIIINYYFKTTLLTKVTTYKW